MEQSAAAIRAVGLTKTYGEGETAVRALRGVDLEIPMGELVVLLGPSGSGKTTFLNQVGALETPTAGRIEGVGVDLGALDEDGRSQYRLHSVGFVFQFYNLIPTLTALENVALIAELTGPDPEERSRVALARVGLEDRGDHFPGQLSGGEQQRVSIARGLVKDAPLLLADEPTGSLDVATGIDVLQLLRDLVADGRRTVIVVTHNREIARIAHRVVELRDGEVVHQQANAEPADPARLDW